MLQAKEGGVLASDSVKACQAQSPSLVHLQMLGPQCPVGRPNPPAYSFYKGVTWSCSKPNLGCGLLLCGCKVWGEQDLLGS